MSAHLQSLTDAELAQRIIDTLDDRDAAALASACLMAHAHGKDRPDVKTARTCCTLADALTFQASACSRPPPPMTRTFIANQPRSTLAL